MNGWVSFPMYDWPETRAALERFWIRVRSRLADDATDWPDALRHDEPAFRWLDPAMLVSQTCGFPYCRRLVNRVALVATPSYRVEGMYRGRYRSLLLARRTDSRRGLHAFRGATIALNARDSQSGCNALLDLLHRRLGHDRRQRFFGGAVITGSHRGSILAVANGEADLCAVDPVSLAIARRHEPASRNLSVRDRTVATPGLPLIAAAGSPLATSAGMRAAFLNAWQDSIDAHSRRDLFLDDIVSIPVDDYLNVADRTPALEPIVGSTSDVSGLHRIRYARRVRRDVPFPQMPLTQRDNPLA